MSISEKETADIQGFLLSGFRNLPYTAYLFLNLTKPAFGRTWLRELIPLTTTSKREVDERGKAIKPGQAINVALTYGGLLTLGYPEEQAKDTFAEQFRQGMAEESRSRRLGDTGGSAPKFWEIGGVSDPAEKSPTSGVEIHALLILQAPDQAKLQALVGFHRDLYGKAGGVREAAPIEFGERRADSKEHFGFADGISNPPIEGAPGPHPTDQTAIKAGEFILGYPTEYDKLPPTPTVSKALDRGKHLRPIPHVGGKDDKSQTLDFGRNGTYLVFRKLYQDVAAFRRFVAANGGTPAEQEMIAAKMVGRWRSGAPLVLSPDRDDPALAQPDKSNSFMYTPTDRHGLGCPIGAHIRRSNPRDSLGDPHASLRTSRRHSILRRGAGYGDPLPEGVMEDDDKPRGLLFICMNSDIERQFEFIQQTWCNNPKFGGLYDDRDPIIGDNMDPLLEPAASGRSFTIQRSPTRMKLENLPRFVTMKGGAYFFLPSIAALRFLSELAGSVDSAIPGGSTRR